MGESSENNIPIPPKAPLAQYPPNISNVYYHSRQEFEEDALLQQGVKRLLYPVCRETRSQLLTVNYTDQARLLRKTRKVLVC